MRKAGALIILSIVLSAAPLAAGAVVGADAVFSAEASHWFGDELALRTSGGIGGRLRLTFGSRAFSAGPQISYVWHSSTIPAKGVFYEGHQLAGLGIVSYVGLPHEDLALELSASWGVGKYNTSDIWLTSLSGAVGLKWEIGGFDLTPRLECAWNHSDISFRLQVLAGFSAEV